MGERSIRRGAGAGAPFYAPPRRKTSAEIISEARAAIYGDLNGASGGSGGVLRPLRTRRPFTPREPQRGLFTEKACKRDTRPPSAFDLNHLSLSETTEEALVSSGTRISSLNEDGATETHANVIRKKNPLRNQSRSVQERSGDGWAGFTKLPHLSGRSKPLHRRNTSACPEESIAESELGRAISVTRPPGFSNSINDPSSTQHGKSLSPPAERKRSQFSSTKSASYDTCSMGGIPVKQLAVQMPNTSNSQYERLSVLELSEALCEKSRDTDRNLQLLESLQNHLEVSAPSGSLRDLVLRSMYAHIDCEDERVLVAIARAMFTMRVTGPHLSAACKLVFKIARNDKNDHYFRESNLLELLIEGCGRADPLTEDSCIVYGAGALRFLALEPALCTLAHRAGALHLAALHLKLLNSAKADNPRSLSEQSTHALYQLTGALRNLAGASENEQRTFVASGALAELVTALVHHTDRDVLTNVARCLSVLSAEAHCCEYLCSNPSSARAILLALTACASRAPLAVRLAYTLGNMAAANETTGLQIYNEDGGVDVLLTILESYTKRGDCGRDADIDPDMHLVGTDLGGSDGSNEDVLIKTVRVIANLCLSERAGRGLAMVNVERTVKALLACLDLAEKSMAAKSSAADEASSERSGELATAVLATLNNITFYRDPPDPPDPTDDTLDLICKATMCWLRCAHAAAAREAVRALGNVSRCARAAQLILIDDKLHLLTPFLQHEDPTVRCSAAGVLVNVCGSGVDAAAAAALAADALGVAAAARDADAAALLARALWNSHAHRPLSAAHRDQAANALAVFIDDESVFAACEASKLNDRRASDPQISKHHVKFTVNNNHQPSTDWNYQHSRKNAIKSHSVDDQLQEFEEDSVSGEDLGFEEGDLNVEECECGPCRRLYAWEELVGVAIPLLEKIRPNRSDASVGTD